MIRKNRPKFRRSVARHYEAIRQQADADRTHKEHFSASRAFVGRAERLSEELTSDGCSTRPSAGLPLLRNRAECKSTWWCFDALVVC
jgi:hypothetical protein